MPLGSFSGGFSSTAGYVPGNEAQCPEGHERLNARWLISAVGCCSFLSEQLGLPEGDLSKPFGFGSWR